MLGTPRSQLELNITLSIISKLKMEYIINSISTHNLCKYTINIILFIYLLFTTVLNLSNGLDILLTGNIYIIYNKYNIYIILFGLFTSF